LAKIAIFFYKSTKIRTFAAIGKVSVLQTRADKFISISAFIYVKSYIEVYVG